MTSPDSTTETEPTRGAGHDPTAADMMCRELVVVPRRMLVREAARLLQKARAGAAAVVDEHGRCVGMLSPTDVYHWVEAGCPDQVLSLDRGCPYQIRGHLLTGEDAVICIRSPGSCPYQMSQPTLGGGHTDVCTLPVAESPPPGTAPQYMTPQTITIKAQTPLSEVARRLIDTRADRLIVIDELEHPVGMLSATDVLRGRD